MYSLRDKAVCCSSQRFERVFKFDYRIGIISVLAKKKQLAVHRKHNYAIMLFGYGFWNVFNALRPSYWVFVLHFTTKLITSVHFASSYFFVGQSIAHENVNFICVQLTALAYVYASSFLSFFALLLSLCHSPPSFSTSRSCRNLFQLISAGPFYLPKVKFNYMLLDEWDQW